MKIFFDTEFLDFGTTVVPLSIGMVREDGKKYYAELFVSNDVLKFADPWVVQNVLPLLTGNKISYQEAASQINSFCSDSIPEFWAYFSAYDWMCLCSLFGGMLKVPRRWPNWCRDIMHLYKEVSYSLKRPIEMPKQTTVQHHALNDAEWNKQIFDYLQFLKNSR